MEKKLSLRSLRKSLNLNFKLCSLSGGFYDIVAVKDIFFAPLEGDDEDGCWKKVNYVKNFSLLHGVAKKRKSV